MTASGSEGSGGGGGGGGGGEDSGESGGGDVSGGDYDYNRYVAEVTFEVAPHSSISVYEVLGSDYYRLIETVTESGERIYDTTASYSPDLRFVFTADPGYVLTECKLVGAVFMDDGLVILHAGEPNILTLISNVVPNSYRLSIGASAGANISVYRSSSEITAAGTLYNGDVIYYDDVIRVNFSPDAGYRLSTHTVNGATFESGDSIVVNDNLTVAATAVIDEHTPETPDTAHIDIGTSVGMYQIFVDTGTTWGAYSAFIDNGTEYKPYS
jgi:hypothetical protein